MDVKIIHSAGENNDTWTYWLGDVSRPRHPDWTHSGQYEAGVPAAPSNYFPVWPTEGSTSEDRSDVFSTWQELYNHAVGVCEDNGWTLVQ